MSRQLDALQEELIPRKQVPVFWPGDEVAVHVKIREGEKERVQVFAGTCIARKGKGVRETFTVRKLSSGEGVERVFPVHSPHITKIEVLKGRAKSGIASRAKLYYLRRK